MAHPVTHDAERIAVAVGDLAPGQRFVVAGLGDRRGVLLRVTELSAIVAYDKRDGERRKPIPISLGTKVYPEVTP